VEVPELTEKFAAGLPLTATVLSTLEVTRRLGRQSGWATLQLML